MILFGFDPSKAMVGLMGLFFALGYTVAKVADRADPRQIGAAPTAAAPMAAAPVVVPAAAPAPAAAAAPVAAPAPAPAPVVAAAPVAPPPVSPPPAAPPPAAPPPAAPPPAVPATPPPAAPAAAPAQPPADPNQVWKVSVRAEDAQFGPEDAPATVVLFSSFGCSPCTPFAEARTKLKEKFGDKVRLVWKHKVVPAQHPDAIAASTASLAAKNQGKFWEYHDKLFATQALDPASLEQHAKDLALDLDKFKADMASPALRGQALTDALLANEVAAHSMPNVLVNGVRMAGDKSVDNMMTVVEAQLARAEAAIKGGADAKTYYDKAVSSGKTFPQMDPVKITVSDVNTPILGKKDAPITVTAFEDFECPFCAQIAPAIKAFHYANPDQVRILYKFTPLRDIHPKAQLACEAAAEAEAQGKFWEYKDALYQNQKALDRADLERYAEQLGLDMAAFKAALDTGKHKATIDAHLAEAGRAQVSGTPSIYINGQKYQGPRGYPPEGMEAIARAYFGMK